MYIISIHICIIVHHYKLRVYIIVTIFILGKNTLIPLSNALMFAFIADLFTADHFTKYIFPEIYNSRKFGKI